MIGHPDGNQMILAKNIDLGAMDGLVRQAVQLGKRKERLVGSLDKDAILLTKKCVSYESSHGMLGTLKLFTGTLIATTQTRQSVGPHLLGAAMSVEDLPGGEEWCSLLTSPFSRLETRWKRSRSWQSQPMK
jgi:hypothetical protein